MQTTTAGLGGGGGGNVIKKVPGEVKAVGKLSHEVAAKVRCSDGKSVWELKDLLGRQNGILSDARLLRSLPDGGAKVKRRKEQLEKMVMTDAATNLLARLSLIDTNQMEWKNRQGQKLDSDDDDDLLKMLAIRSEVPPPPPKPVERSFVPATCARPELSEKQKSAIPLQPRQQHRCHTDEKTKSDPMPVENLMPPLRNKRLVTLNLKESLCLQSEHENKVKRLWLQNATKRLKEQSLMLPESPDLHLPTGDDAMSYRNVDVDDDEEDEDEVKFTITEYEQ